MALYRLAFSGCQWHRQAMHHLQDEPFYQSFDDLVRQLLELVRQITAEAEDGNEDSFWALDSYLRGTDRRWPYADYPSVYPELVDRYVKSPTYNQTKQHITLRQGEDDGN